MVDGCCDTVVAQEPPSASALAGLPHQNASFTASSLILAPTTADNSLCDLPLVCFDEMHKSCNPPAAYLLAPSTSRYASPWRPAQVLAAHRVAWRERSWVLSLAIDLEYGAGFH
jgi:hypothetical protein